MTKINGDTVDAFIENANKKFGGSDVGETKANPAFSYSFKGGTLTKVNFTCPITLDFAEVGGGKPNAANKDAIAKVASSRKITGKTQSWLRGSFQELRSR